MEGLLTHILAFLAGETIALAYVVVVTIILLRGDDE